MRDAIEHLRPSYAILENVAAHLSLGFGQVLGDLAEIGYDAEWEVVPAAAVGAPHRRNRVFIIAYPNVQPDLPPRHAVGRGESAPIKAWGPKVWNKHSGRCRWPTEPRISRVDNGVPNGVDRIRGLGNAVVPQVAEMIGKLVMKAAKQ